MPVQFYCILLIQIKVPFQQVFIGVKTSKVQEDFLRALVFFLKTIVSRIWDKKHPNPIFLGKRP